LKRGGSTRAGRPFAATLAITTAFDFTKARGVSVALATVLTAGLGAARGAGSRGSEGSIVLTRISPDAGRIGACGSGLKRSCGGRIIAGAAVAGSTSIGAPSGAGVSSITICKLRAPRAGSGVKAGAGAVCWRSLMAGRAHRPRLTPITAAAATPATSKR